MLLTENVNQLFQMINAYNKVLINKGVNRLLLVVGILEKKFVNVNYYSQKHQNVKILLWGKHVRLEEIVNFNQINSTMIYSTMAK